MLSAGVPIAKVAKIVGWSPSTMVKTAARDGHFTTDDLRSAMESISSVEAEENCGRVPGTASINAGQDSVSF